MLLHAHLCWQVLPTLSTHLPQTLTVPRPHPLPAARRLAGRAGAAAVAGGGGGCAAGAAVSKAPDDQVRWGCGSRWVGAPLGVWIRFFGCRPDPLLVTRVLGFPPEPPALLLPHIAAAAVLPPLLGGRLHSAPLFRHTVVCASAAGGRPCRLTRASHYTSAGRPACRRLAARRDCAGGPEPVLQQPHARERCGELDAGAPVESPMLCLDTQYPGQCARGAGKCLGV